MLGRHMAVHWCLLVLPLLNTALHCFFASFSYFLSLFAFFSIAFSSALFFCSLILSSSSIIAIHSSAVACWVPPVFATHFFLLDVTLPTCSGCNFSTTYRATRAHFTSLFSILSFSTSIRLSLCCRFLCTINESAVGSCAVGSTMEDIDSRADELPVHWYLTEA